MVAEDSRRADDSLGYKPFVDGLRAVSIVAVVAYHARLPGVTGGFVGVDIFFVISGYLIINQIVAGLRAGRFSFAGFWARRVLRILPPYLLVIAAALAIAPFVFVAPREYTELGHEALRSAFMIVNNHFYGQQGYFDTAAETKPLLHLWSLAVEEQFYLAAPLLLFGLWAAARRFPGASRALWTTAIATLLLASFVLCVTGTTRDQNPAFYLTPYRAWEFILGGLVPFAVPAVRRLPPAAAELAGIAGAALILAAIFSLGRGTPYPSYFAALPVVGACLVILAGLVRPEVAVARALAVPPMVWIGLVSYAWYLWHWPLLTFVRIHNFGESLPAWDWPAIALSLVLAAATHHLLEVPIRRWRERRGKVVLGWKTVGAGAGAAVAVALVGLAYSDRVAPTIERQAPELWADLADVDDACALVDPTRLTRECRARLADRPIGLLVGNSHARMLYTTLLASAEQAGTVLVSLVTPGCKPYFPIDAVKSAGLRDACNTRFAAGLATLSRELPQPPDYAVVSARWNAGLNEERIAARLTEDAFAAAGLPWPAPEGIRLIMAAGLGTTLARIEAMGTRRILLIGPVPELRFVAPDCVVRVDARGLDRDRCAVARGPVEARRRTTIATLRFLAEAFPNIRFIDPIDVFCDKALCRPFDDAGVLYVDDDHLSPRGARKIEAAFPEAFAWALGEPTTESAALPAQAAVR